MKWYKEGLVKRNCVRLDFSLAGLIRERMRMGDGSLKIIFPKADFHLGTGRRLGQEAVSAPKPGAQLPWGWDFPLFWEVSTRGFAVPGWRTLTSCPTSLGLDLVPTSVQRLHDLGKSSWYHRIGISLLGGGFGRIAKFWGSW